MLYAARYFKLQRLLPYIDVIVPPRGAGRKSSHVERYAVLRLLASLPLLLLQFPVRLRKSERPDFVLYSGSRIVGIEHTEAIPPNQAWSDTLRREIDGPKSWYLRRAVVGEPTKRKEELLNEIARNDPGAGWSGDSVEREWAAAIAYSVEEKIASALKSGYKRFDENWLLIYDNWPAPALDHEKASPMLREKLEAMPAWKTFSRVFVLDETILLSFDAHAVSVVAVKKLRHKTRSARLVSQGRRRFRPG